MPIYYIFPKEGSVNHLKLDETLKNTRDSSGELIRQIHTQAFNRGYCKRPLEVSVLSNDPIAKILNPFNLKILMPDGRTTCVESAWHGSKVFNCCGPFNNLYMVPGYEAKTDRSINKWHRIVANHFFDTRMNYLTNQRGYLYQMFHCWLYITALLQNNFDHELLDRYDAFTDIFYDRSWPGYGFDVSNAKALTVYCHLKKLGMLDVPSITPDELISMCLNSKETFLGRSIYDQY